MLNVPEYFGDYRDKGEDLAAFLGTSIAAKVCILILTGPIFFNSSTPHPFRSHSTNRLVGISYPKPIITQWDLVPFLIFLLLYINTIKSNVF